MTRTCVGPGATNTGADRTSCKAAGPCQRSAPRRTETELLAWLAAVRHIAEHSHRDVRWALPADVREAVAA